MTRGLKIIIAALVLNLFSAVASRAADPDEIMATLLFPSSKDWLAVSTLPRLSPEQLETLEPRLKPALHALAGEDGFESDACSISERVFQSGASFYVLDVNGDGLDDILYTGSIQCAEGGLHVIWHADGQGDYAIRDKKLKSSYILRIKPDQAEPLKVTFEPGCCAAFIDSYYQDAPGEPGKYAGQTFRAALDASLPVIGKPIVLGEWVEVRSTPEANNVYNPEMSAGLGYVFMGNIVAVVSSYNYDHCHGTLIHYDPTGDWAFVALDGACIANQRFSVSAGDFVRAGWVERTTFTLAPEPQPPMEADHALAPLP